MRSLHRPCVFSWAGYSVLPASSPRDPASAKWVLQVGGRDGPCPGEAKVDADRVTPEIAAAAYTGEPGRQSSSIISQRINPSLLWSGPESFKVEVW